MSALEATRRILIERNIELPLKEPPKKPLEKTAILQKSRHRNSACVLFAIIGIYWIVQIAYTIWVDDKYSAIPGAVLAFIASLCWLYAFRKRNLKESPYLVFGLLCAMGSIFGLFVASFGFISGDFPYSIGSFVPFVILLYLASYLSFKR